MVEVTDEHREFLLATARRAARNTGGSVSDVAKRAKSVAWLVGKLRKRFSLEMSDAKAIVRAVTLSWRGDLDFAEVEGEERVRRPFVKGREPLDSSKWDERISKLTASLVGPFWKTEEIYAVAKSRLKWRESFSLGVLAAADNRKVLGWFTSSRLTGDGQWAAREVADRLGAQFRALRNFNVPDRDLKGAIETTVEWRDGRWVPYRLYSEDQMAELQARRTAEEKVIRDESDHGETMAKTPAPELSAEQKLEKLKAAHLRASKFEGRLKRRKDALMAVAEEKIDAELSNTRKLAESARRTFELELAALTEDSPEEDEDED